MEGVLVQNQLSSGKITRHKSELLDNENDDIGMMQDSLETRRHSSGTHSSEESRLIDGSPDRYYDEDPRSEGSIETEKQYQEDLKERVKRSFAELGLNPDIQGNKEKSISPRDSLEIPVDFNEHTVEKDNGIYRGSEKNDFDEHNYIKEEAVVTPLMSKSSNCRQSGSESKQNSNDELSNQFLYQEGHHKPYENFREQKQFANHNQNNSVGIVDDENHEDDHPSTLPNDSEPLNDDLQLKTISVNNSEESEVENKKDLHASGSINSSPKPVNSRKGSAGKTYKDSSLNIPMRKTPSGKQLELQLPENKFLNPKRSSVVDHGPLQDNSVMKEEGGSKNQIQTLAGGETVRVEYISDDSGDDDEHYVDEKGSPIHFEEEKEEAHQQEYRIKPKPPATPIDSSKQHSKLRRYSLERHRTPSREELIIDASNAGILSIEKVPNAEQASWNKLKDTEETIIVGHDAGTGNIGDSIPNLMKHENNKYASATSKEHVESESKFVDANTYAKIQHRAQQKIKSREVSAGRQLKKEYVKPHQPSRYHSSRTSTGTKERLVKNGSTNLGSKGTSNEMPNSVQQLSPSNDKLRSKNIPLSIDRSKNILETDEVNNNRKAHLMHEREITGENQNLQSRDHSSQHQPVYPNQNDNFGGKTSNTLPSAPPFVETGYQRNLKIQSNFQEHGNDQQHAFLYGGSNEGSQYPAHPIQPAYQPVSVQQQHVLYSQGAASHQGQHQQQHAQHYQSSAPYQAPPQHNQRISNSHFGYQMEPMHYHNENQYQSDHQNRFPLQHNQYEAPYHNYNQANQHTYQTRSDNQIPIQSYQSRQANVNYPENQLNINTDKNQHWQVRQGGQSFHLHSQDTYAAGPHDVLTASNTQAQWFYQENQQEQPQQQFQSQLVSQQHIQPAHQSLQGSQSQPLYGMQSNQQTSIPHYQMQEGQQQQQIEAYEEIPPLDLSGLVEDRSQSTRHVSKQTNSTKKTIGDKSKINFIEQNKAKLRGELPQKSYLSRYKKDINPKKPLPGISRENSEERNEQWPQIQPDINNYEGTWITDPGVERRRFMELPRQQSDTGVRYSNTDLGNIMSPEYHTSSNPQSAPVNFQMGNVFHNAERDNERTSPPFNTHGSQIQFASFSADHATSYARMQYKPKVNSKLEHSPRLSVHRPGPYTVLPNIEDQNKGSEELQKSDQDGYLAKMQKSKQGPQYKQYTLKDYQKLRVDTKLGGLGPDTEAAQIKQEKAMRQREYAKQVMMQNRKVFQKSKAPGWVPQQPSPQDRGLTKRDIAIEYSKKVPKPRVPTPPEEQHERIYGASSSSRDSNVDTDKELKQLEQLRLRHEKEKQEVAKIKKEIRT